MKKLFVGLVCAVLVSVMALPAFAGPTDEIEVTLNPQASASILCNRSEWNPSCGLGGTEQTDIDWGDLDNDGTVSVSVKIAGEDTEDWAISDSSAGHNQFKPMCYIGGSWEPFDADPEVFDDNIAYNEHVTFGLNITMPTSSSTGDIQHFTITFSATVL